MEEQLDDTADWLDSKSAPSVIEPMSGVKRISIAVIQSELLLAHHRPLADVRHVGSAPRAIGDVG